jgi:hypothetical protein
MKKLTLSQLEQYLSKAAWILKGPVDASDFKVYIFPLHAVISAVISGMVYLFTVLLCMK